MSFNSKETFPDALAEWVKGNDGRLYVNLMKGKIFSQGFRQKIDLVVKGQLPEADSEDNQESYNAFQFEGKTFSISQFDKGNGLQTLVYQGTARYPSNKPLVNPYAGQQTLPVQDNNNTG